MSKKDLKGIANKVLARCLSDSPWNPTTDTIRRAYKLNDAQVKTVKDYAKRFAAEQNLMWGWDPHDGFFRFVPANSPSIADRMLNYAIQSWSNSGKSIRWLIQGATAEGYVSIGNYVLAIEQTKAARVEIEKVYEHLVERQAIEA